MLSPFKFLQHGKPPPEDGNDGGEGEDKDDKEGEGSDEDENNEDKVDEDGTTTQGVQGPVAGDPDSETYNDNNEQCEKDADIIVIVIHVLKSSVQYAGCIRWRWCPPEPRLNGVPWSACKWCR
jgi:hypothetical protein